MRNEELKKKCVVLMGGIESLCVLKEKGEDVMVGGKKDEYDVS